jgi:NAD(P)-dependent dehydrogenase (short-subunit alcohol dehydrogenase family)
LNQNIFLTGGSSGIGRELVLQLSKQNNVFFTYLNNCKFARQVQNVSQKKSFIFNLDLASKKKIKNCTLKLKEKFPIINLVILNACAPAKRISFKSLTLEEIEEKIKTNYLGNLIIIKNILNLYKNCYGKLTIAHISSAEIVKKGGWNLCHYSPLKSAIDNLFLCLKREYSNKVQFISIKIGPTNTSNYPYKNNKVKNVNFTKNKILKALNIYE